MSKKHKKPKFSIEDAFEEDPDDAIRIYGATSERSPLRPVHEDTDIDLEVRIEDPLLSKQGNPNSLGSSFRLPQKSAANKFLALPCDDTISRDSDSLIPNENDSFYGASDSPHWWCLHPKVKENWRVVALAFTLFFLGLVLLIIGILIEAIPIESLSGVVFLLAGLICFVPGIYHVIYIILAIKGVEGYDFYSLPWFN